MDIAQRIAAHLRTLKVEPGTTYVMRDPEYQPTGEYFVVCDVGLYVGRVSQNEYGNHVLSGAITPWRSVGAIKVETDGLLAQEAPFALKVAIDKPKFDASWMVSQRASSPADLDELAAFALDVLRQQSKTDR